MTINDLELCEHYRVLFAYFSVIENYTRNGQTTELFHALDMIHDASRKAMYRLNDMRFQKKKEA